MKCTLSKFAADTKLRGEANIVEGGGAIQSDLDKPEKWTHGNLTRFNKTKCEVLQLDCDTWGNPWYQSRLGNEQHDDREQPASKDLAMLGNEKLDVSH
ncbi:rna-directed dna polymerase from mobile element jockey-like [Pitangus sulphuratus]|nr:rna-directed dna polymerase from mobile element jockey-like [Pitangus sulphuratus]